MLSGEILERTGDLVRELSRLANGQLNASIEAGKASPGDI
jgi:hypothetical protein